VKSELKAGDLGILLALAYQTFVQRLRASLVEQGFDDLGRSDGYVFRQLAGRTMTVSALAGRLDISKQAAAQLIEDLRSRGYVIRRPDPSDGRAQLLELSERGAAVLAAARRFHRRYERSLSREDGRDTVLTVRTLLASKAGDEEVSPDPHLRAMYL
jgi:DNA-binding MarR family transcriptional regulator